MRSMSGPSKYHKQRTKHWKTSVFGDKLFSDELFIIDAHTIYSLRTETRKENLVIVLDVSNIHDNEEKLWMVNVLTKTFSKCVIVDFNEDKYFYTPLSRVYKNIDTLSIRLSNLALVDEFIDNDVDLLESHDSSVPMLSQLLSVVREFRPIDVDVLLGCKKCRQVISLVEAKSYNTIPWTVERTSQLSRLLACEVYALHQDMGNILYSVQDLRGWKPLVSGPPRSILEFIQKKHLENSCVDKISRI